MDKLTRKHLREPLKKGSKRVYYEQEYFIYTQDEANVAKIAYVRWHAALPGQWGLSDDGFVAVCLKRREYKDKHDRAYLNYVYPYGQAFFRPYMNQPAKLLYLTHVESGDFSNVTTKPHWEQKKGKTQYKNFVKVYVSQMLNNSVDFNKLGEVFDKDEPMPVIKAKALLKKEYIKEMIDTELQKVMTQKNLSKETVLDWITTAAGIAGDKGDAGNLLKAAHELGDILHIKDNKEPDGIDAEFTQLEGVETAVFKEIEGGHDDVEVLDTPVRGEKDVSADNSADSVTFGKPEADKVVSTPK